MCKAARGREGAVPTACESFLFQRGFQLRVDGSRDGIYLRARERERVDALLYGASRGVELLLAFLVGWRLCASMEYASFVSRVL